MSSLLFCPSVTDYSLTTSVLGVPVWCRTLECWGVGVPTKRGFSLRTCVCVYMCRYVCVHVLGVGICDICLYVYIMCVYVRMWTSVCIQTYVCTLRVCLERVSATSRVLCPYSYVTVYWRLLWLTFTGFTNCTFTHLV